MSDIERCLERQEREIKERRHRRVEEKRVQQEEDEQVAIAMGLLDLPSQSRRRCSQVGRGRTWTDICILWCDAAGVLGLFQEQKLTAVIRMLVYGSSADQVDEIARTIKSLVRFCDAIETLYNRDYLQKPTHRDL
ncbi:unnamed protein product [Prunus armeniaca]